MTNGYAILVIAAWVCYGSWRDTAALALMLCTPRRLVR